MGNLTSPKFPEDENPGGGVLHPDGLILGGLPKPAASLDLHMDPVDLGTAWADIDKMVIGTMPRTGDTPDYTIRPVDMPRYRFYPDRLEVDHALLGEPHVRAMLATIRGREGGQYNKIVGGQTFEDYSRHPNIKVGNSHAAGAYQIQPGTWNPIRNALGIPDFSPPSQDLAAVDLLRQMHATDRLLSGDVDGAILAAGRQWLAFPLTTEQKRNGRGEMRGVGINDIPTNRLDDIREDYLRNLR